MAFELRRDLLLLLVVANRVLRIRKVCSLHCQPEFAWTKPECLTVIVSDVGKELHDATAG